MAGQLVTRSGGRKRQYGGHRLNSEINVTPFVDVMLVLLIIFMVSAPLLTVGVPINLPDSDAATLNSESAEPVSVSIALDGGWFVGDVAVDDEAGLLAEVDAITGGDRTRKLYLRADTALNYGEVMRMMGAVSGAGYTRLALIAQQPDS